MAMLYLDDQELNYIDRLVRADQKRQDQTDPNVREFFRGLIDSIEKEKEDA